MVDESNDREGVWSRAGRDTDQTRRSFWFWLFGVVVSAVPASAIPGVDLADRSIIFGGVLVGVVAAMFCWHLVRAPYKQRDEAHARADKAEQRFTDEEACKEQCERLYERAQTLIGPSKSRPRVDLEPATRWRQDAENALRECVGEDAVVDFHKGFEGLYPEEQTPSTNSSLIGDRVLRHSNHFRVVVHTYLP